jgi:uncharacterized membrane protein YkoI
MRKSHFISIIICFCCCLMTADAGAYAWPGELLLAQAVGLSQDEAAAKVREETGGRVLDVQTGTQDGLAVYLVKVLLPDGRVRVVTVSSQ